MHKKITENQVVSIVSLAKQGYKNRQICIELGIKECTLQYWKKTLRAQGIDIPENYGRIAKTDPPRYIAKIAEMQRLENELKNL